MPVSSGPIQVFGNYHLVLIHFPIALIIMAGIAELIYCFSRNSAFNFTVNFLLIAAVLSAIPTAFSGLAFEEGGSFFQEGGAVLWWHRFFGFFTMSLSILTIALKVYLGRGVFYFGSLILLIASVCLAAHFGGLLAFGELAWY